MTLQVQCFALLLVERSLPRCEFLQTFAWHHPVYLQSCLKPQAGTDVVTFLGGLEFGDEGVRKRIHRLENHLLEDPCTGPR